MESTRQTAVSAFLQEKLQRERKAEDERLGHTTAIGRINTEMSASVDLGRAIPESPTRIEGMSLGSPRPRSSGGVIGGAEPPKKQSLGLMEMEKVLSKLHKQNFDLKLELFHRREKQTAFENQVEALENEKREIEQINDNLLEELDKRDKAIEEAVAMIVTLEARVKQLVSERDMVQQIDRDGFFYSQDYNNVKFENPQVPNLCVHKPPLRSQGDDTKSINRMPSFLSEKTENTENLRDVYLGVLGSAFSLQKVTDGEPEPEPENAHANGLASPTLSVLSESSFMSVYGKKEEAEGYPPPIDQPLSLDGAEPVQSGVFTPEVLQGMAKGKMGSLPGRSASANPFVKGRNAGPFSLSTGHFGHGYPGQQPERPSTTRSDGKRGPQPPPLQIGTPARSILKDGTRDALKRAIAEAHGGVRLHEQGFPPTPDTISTPGLDQMRGSNDSFINIHANRNQHHQQTACRDSFDSEKSDQQQNSGASLTESRPFLTTYSSFTEKRFKKDSKDALRGVFLRRSNTTRESSRRGNIIEEEEDRVDTDDDSDSRSLQSSMDIWMRESIKPAKKGSGGSGSSQPSPDLFGFPSSPLKSAWVPEAIFGATSPRPGQQGIGYDAAYLHDLLSLRQALFAANVAPAPPDRRSSLAHTNSGSASPRVVPIQPVQETDSKSRHLRGHSDTQAILQTPVQKFAQIQPGSEKRSHYPPIVGQQGGARAGFNRLFRRSTGDNLSANSTPKAVPPSASEQSLAEAPKITALNSGVPFWINKALAAGDENDRSGATPPPITTNPRQRRRNTAGAEMMPAHLQLHIAGREPMSDIPEGGRQSPVPQKLSAPGTPSGTGIRRKWLPAFTRTGSAKKA
ncbi:hypothetical protein ESCO_001335 [Escovopsis weberi]|uniref:Centrosomin N-terminal motif 1 domain-containing protein n=1 Tax=Escovopsis weberi TaxID=150374 RepID=A0A0M8MW31_ESCWE|nr:hypothetical protein ESCO_001335 [Escovopsis weberi]